MARSLKVKPELLETVKLALRRSGARQTDFALELALSRTVVSKFFNGYPVSSSSFQEICHKLRLSWEEIAGLSNVDRDHADDSKIYVELGNAHAESGRYEEAIASYDKAIEINPDFYEAWLNRGEALFNLGIYEEFNFVRYEEAIASHNRAIKINPDCYQAWFNRGEALTKIMKFEEAIASYEKAIKINPNCYQAWFKKGLLLSELGRFEAAIASYNKTIEIKPEHWQVWFNQGVLLSKLERFEAAIASYDKTIEISPNFYEAYFNRGLSLFYLGQYDQALTSYDKVIEIKPDCVEAWNSRGITLATLKQYEQALISYDKVIEIKPDSVEGWNSRGLVLVSLGQFEEAIASFDKAIELKLDFHQAWHNRGIAARKSASCDQFLAFSSAIVRQNPALNQRGYAGELASYQEGLKYCQQTTHPEDWGILHQALGDAHYLQGKGKSNYWEYWHKAITEYYQTLITLTPEAFPELYLEVVQSLIRALFGLEQIHEAEELKQRGLDVLRHLLSSSLSEQKKQHLTQKFSNFTQLAAITLEKVDIDYDILLNISSETILIGEEYEFTVFVNPHTLDKGNRYLLEISPNEAIGNELNIFLTAPGFQFNGDNTTSLPLDPDTTNINQTATFNLIALRPGKTKIKAELYCGETYKTTLETEIEVTAFEETELRPLIAARSRPVPQPDIILQVRTTWNADISACTFNYHIDSYQPRLLFADDVDYNSQSLSNTWVERSHSLLKTTLEEAATSLREDFRSRLVSLGQYLFESLLPEELQNTFRTIASFKLPFTLLILSDQDAWFPWELLHDGQKFLGDRFIIGRWLWELEKSRPYEFPVGAVNVAHYASVEQHELYYTEGANRYIY